MQQADKLRELYRQDLKTWLEATDQNQKYLAEEVTIFFSFNQSQGISEDAYGRTIRADEKIPSSNRGVWNVIYVLASFYALGVIELEQAKQFLLSYNLENPNKEKPEALWQEFEEGKKRYLKFLEEKERQKQAEKEKKPQSPPRFMASPQLVSAAIIPVLLLGFFIYQFQRPKGSLLENCDSPVAASDPVFLGDQGFSQFTADSLNPNSSLLSDNVRKIAINESGIWLGYMAGNVDGISLYNGSSWIHCHGLNIGAGQNINDFLFADNAIYIATDGSGVIRLSPEGWYQYDMSHIDNRVYSLYENDNRIWASTYLGLAELQGNQWQAVYQANPDGLKSSHVFQYLHDESGNEWFGLLSEGISRLSPEGDWQSSFNEQVSLQNIRGIARAEDGSLWFASDGQGIAHFQNGLWQQFTTETSNLNSNRIYDIEIDKFGRIWLAGDSGISYTDNDGLDWLVYSTMPSVDIEFGCSETICPHPYNDNHIWIVLANGAGIGHVRIPPLEPTIRVVSVSERAELRPEESFVFEIQVEVIGEQLTEADGDSLRSAEPKEANLYNAYHTIPVTGETLLANTFTFSNLDNPIIAPAEPGLYRLEWRVWQGRRFVTEPIVIEFEVLAD